MQVIFPNKILGKDNEDRLFLESLDKRLHYVQRSLAETNISRSVHEIAIDLYHHDQKLSKNELEKAVDVIRSLGIEEEVRRQALHYAEMAKKSLSNYSGTAKTELIDLLDFVVKRSV